MRNFLKLNKIIIHCIIRNHEQTNRLTLKLLTTKWQWRMRQPYMKQRSECQKTNKSMNYFPASQRCVRSRNFVYIDIIINCVHLMTWNIFRSGYTNTATIQYVPKICPEFFPLFDDNCRQLWHSTDDVQLKLSLTSNDLGNYLDVL